MRLKIGNRLLSAREDRKMNQTEMAEFLGLSQASYSRFERNENSATLEQILSFSRTLEIPVQEFLPETTAIHSNNHNGQVGFVIGSFYSYGDKELAQENQYLKEKIEMLEKRITDLEEMNALLKEKNNG